jgi:site-specific recombinase XerD
LQTRPSLTVRAGKDNQDRVVFLTPLLSQALQRYLPYRQAPATEPRLFLLKSQRSPSTTTIRERLDGLARPLGLHVYPHQLRHTLATRLLNRGMPIHSLQKLLDHQQLSTTQIYAQLYDETLHYQFQTAMAGLEPVPDWPRPLIDQGLPLPVDRLT